MKTFDVAMAAFAMALIGALVWVWVVGYIQPRDALLLEVRACVDAQQGPSAPTLDRKVWDACYQREVARAPYAWWSAQPAPEELP